MPRTTKPPAYRLYKRTGQAVVTLNGRDRYLGPHGTKTSRAEYDRLISIWLASGRRMPASQRGGGPTVSELVLAYWDHAKTYYRKSDGTPSREIEVLKYALRRVRQLFGPTSAGEFGVSELATLQQAMIRDRLTRKTINGFIARIVRMFRWGGARGLVDPELHLKLKALDGLRAGRSGARESSPVKAADPEAIDRIMPYLSQPVKGIVRLMRLTGARGQEIRLMRACEIRMDNQPWWHEPETHKSAHHGKQRLIALGPMAQSAVREYLTGDPAAYLFRPADAGHGYHKRKVQPVYSKDALNVAVQRACEKAGVRPFTPHQIRHLVATERERRYGWDAARAALGHTSVHATAVYVDEDLPLMARMALEVG